MQRSTRLHGEHLSLGSLKEALGRDDELRSGDRQAGLSARSMRELAAAKRVLADITLAELREHPSVP